MQKIRKILKGVSEKAALPTNQPTNQPTSYYQKHRFCKTWLTSVQRPLWQHFFLNNYVLAESHGTCYLYKQWLYKLSLIGYTNVVKVYRNDIEFKTHNRQKTRKGEKLVYQQYR